MRVSTEKADNQVRKLTVKDAKVPQVRVRSFDAIPIVVADPLTYLPFAYSVGRELSEALFRSQSAKILPRIA